MTTHRTVMQPSPAELAADMFFIDAMIALVERQRDDSLRAIERIYAFTNRSGVKS
jgi:hypothetical protein